MCDRVVVLGNPVLDYTLEIEQLPVEAGQHQEVHELLVGPGGAANTLIAGARLGLAMQVLGVVGDDATGRQLLDWLRAEGVDVGLVAVERGRRTTTVFVLSAPATTQSFLGFHSACAVTPCLRPLAKTGAPAYRKQGTTAMLPTWEEAIRRAAAFYFDGWTYGTLGPRLVLQAVRLAFGARVPVFFDPGPRLAHFDPQWLSDALRCTSVLSLTEDEARTIVSGTKSPEELARDLRARGPELVVIKSGAQGCLVQRDGECVSHPGFAVPVRDTTGAGDAVAAAIILACLRGYDLPRLAALANAAGAATVQRLGGGLNLPSAAEIDALLQQGAQVAEN